jgi:hypothetical protein
LLGGTGRLRRGGKFDRDLQRRYELVHKVLEKACDMRDELTTYDRVLADAVKPLAGLNCRQGIY